MSPVGPSLQQKQKSSRVPGLHTSHLKFGSLCLDAQMHNEWKVRCGAQMPVHIKSKPSLSLQPHLAHRSRKLSEASKISAAMVPPSYPGTRSAVTEVPWSNLFANCGINS